jgi:hypothetical protein
MEYEWERKITKRLLERLDAEMPAGLRLIGVAVEHVEGVEGALVTKDRQPTFGDVARADVWSDILGDARSRYGEARDEMMEMFDEIRTKAAQRDV